MPKSYNTVCPRPESCDAPRALMSVAPNLCCDETKNRGTYTHMTIITGTALCAQPPVFPSTHTLGCTFCSTKRAGSIFVKTEAWTMFSISLPRRGGGDSSTIGLPLCWTFFTFCLYCGSFAEWGSCCSWPLPRGGCFSQITSESRHHRCHASVRSLVLCLVTTKIWSNGH